MSLELDKTAEASDRERSANALTAGSQLGKYRLERVLGEGGMGVVWAAKDPDLQRSIAIKLIKHAGAPVQLRQRLLREAIAMAKLKHPNVLTVYEAGTVADRDYIAMELVEGTSLDTWLTAGPPHEEVVGAILAAGRGLAAAHEAGIVHRDFKPHNVLRSRDGRVLVTDFGLARAALEHDEALDAAPHAGDSVLDEKLTQTGALLGTPAYMAPEQYAGAAPDPRTDQFAFCVTAWQALTGERPFKGDTLEELRNAVGGGVAHLQTKLPGPIRAVLARGLDPAPEKRWPSLEALLDAFERAVRVPSRRRTFVARAIVLALAATLAVAIFARGSKPVANACDHPEAAFADAWSPAARATLQRSIGAAPGFDKVATALDQFEERWVTSYEKACRTRTARSFAPRVQCLEGVRDQVRGITEMLKGAPLGVIAGLDMAGMLPQLGACERATPVAPPALPTDEPRRGRVLALYGRMMSLATAPDDQLASVSKGLETDAAALAYPPAVATVGVLTADTYLRRGRRDEARAAYARALPLAKEAGDHRLEASVHIGMLELAMQELAAPGAPRPAKLDDARAQPVLHPELAAAFAAARSAANDDALLRGSIEMSAAAAYLRLAQWNRYRSAYTDALAHVAEAHKQFQSLPDVRRDARASALEARIYLERGDERALDDALFAARRASDMLSAAGEQTLPELDAIRTEVAFARRDYNEVHRIVDKYATRHEPPATTLTGHVTPARRARVIAWSGDLAGDPRRGYIDALPGMFDVTESADDGSFSIAAKPGWAILAEAADLRALPIVIGDKPPVLALAATTTRSATVTGKNLLGVRAFARYGVGASTWELEVPVERDGTFDIRGMPAGGTPVFGLSGPAGDAQRVVTAASADALVWPSGQALDVIIRGIDTDAVTVSAGETNVATAALQPAGASNTDAGREEYRPGDRHAVITGNATGKVSVCAAGTCKTVDVRPTVEVDYPDGRYAAGVTPVVLGP